MCLQSDTTLIEQEFLEHSYLSLDFSPLPFLISLCTPLILWQKICVVFSFEKYALSLFSAGMWPPVVKAKHLQNSISAYCCRSVQILPQALCCWFFCCLHPLRPHTHQRGLMQVLMCNCEMSWVVAKCCKCSRQETLGNYQGYINVWFLCVKMGMYIKTSLHTDKADKLLSRMGSDHIWCH